MAGKGSQPAAEHVASRKAGVERVCEVKRVSPQVLYESPRAVALQYATRLRLAEMTAIDSWHRYATFRSGRDPPLPADHYGRFIPSAEVIGEGQQSAAILDRYKHRSIGVGGIMRRHVRLWVLAPAFGTLLGALPALAQQSAGGAVANGNSVGATQGTTDATATVGLEEVVVTAQRREEPAARSRGRISRVSR